MDTHPPDAISNDEKETGRIEAFSDGVFAIVITLLAIDIKVPQIEGTDKRLLRARLDQWPVYLAFLTSFFNVGIMWINHHMVFKLIKHSDQVFLILNSLLLMFITVVPFSTLLLAEYLQYGDGRVAAMVYAGNFVVTAIFYNLVWRYAAFHYRLLDLKAHRKVVDSIHASYRFGPFFYVAAVIIGALSAAACLVWCLAIAAYFALPRGNRIRVGVSKI